MTSRIDVLTTMMTDLGYFEVSEDADLPADAKPFDIEFDGSDQVEHTNYPRYIINVFTGFLDPLTAQQDKRDITYAVIRALRNTSGDLYPEVNVGGEKRDELVFKFNDLRDRLA